ncbi:MAG: hypothetical protein U0354_10130 [Candidatus Sericytochromatia bacterium]
MAQEYKWKVFYDSSTQNIEDIISSAEEEVIKEEILSKDKEELDSLMNEIEDQFKMPPLLFEDKGIVYSLAQNPYFCSKFSKTQ